MAARLTDKQKKKIIADYVQLGSYNAVSKINGVSATTVKNIVLKSADFVEKCEQKKEENTADILAYMDSQKGVVLLCFQRKFGWQKQLPKLQRLWER